MARVPVIVAIDEAHLDDVSDVVRALEKAGLHVERTLETVGTVTGYLDREDHVQALTRVPGVESVERQRRVDLPPPDSDVQ